MSSTSRVSLLKRFARRVARPVTGPIDGRVADVNRRIAHQGATLKDEIDGMALALASNAESVSLYARSASEVASYTGIELRRIEDTLQAGVERIEEALQENTELAQDRLYRERLAHALDLPLEKLDTGLAHVLNHAAGHRGFAAQATLWFNPPIVVELAEGTAHLSAVNERIVEVPFSMAALGRISPPARILDIGSAESTFPLSAAALGYSVDAIDLRPLPYSHPNLASFAGRFEDWDPPQEPFDAIFLISTIEHVGVGAYGEAAYGARAPGCGADRAMLERLRELLAPGGLLVITTPFGVGKVDGFERTYDEESLGALLEGWEVLERRTVISEGALTWLPGETPDPGERGVAMLIASPARSV